MERIVEKWSKLADAQAKLAATGSGMIRCANVAVVEGSELLGNSKSHLDVAMEEAEQARIALADENTTLRHLVLTTVNQLQAISHDVKLLQTASDEEVRHHDLVKRTSCSRHCRHVAHAIHSCCFISPLTSSCRIRNIENPTIHVTAISLYPLHGHDVYLLQPITHVIAKGQSCRC